MSLNLLKSAKALLLGGMVQIFVVNCVALNDGPRTTADASAIKIQKPPTDDKTDRTADGCGGITEKGKCQQGVAITCVIGRGEIARRDCNALEKDCVMDMIRGAKCLTIEKKEELDPKTTCPGDKMDAKGVCLDGTAIYCDMKKPPGTINVWTCNSETQTCEDGKCREGAFCCDKNPDNTTPHPTGECGEYDFNGKCEGNVAKWCNKDNVLEVEDCSGWDQQCLVDDCATGAFCCEKGDKECMDLGFDGKCLDQNTMTYCEGTSNDEIIIEDCAAKGKVCQVDGPCGTGAYCCDEQTTTNQCLQVGSKGICEGDTLVFCLGTEEKDLKKVDCTMDSMKCAVNTCKPGEAACCNNNEACSTLGTAGKCVNNVLQYCTTQDVYQEKDCSKLLDSEGNPRKCEFSTCQSGYAECCPLE